MDAALKDRLERRDHQDLSKTEFLGLLIDDEWLYRENRKLTARLRSRSSHCAPPRSRVSTTHAARGTQGSNPRADADSMAACPRVAAHEGRQAPARAKRPGLRAARVTPDTLS